MIFAPPAPRGDDPDQFAAAVHGLLQVKAAAAAAWLNDGAFLEVAMTGPAPAETAEPDGPAPVSSAWPLSCMAFYDHLGRDFSRYMDALMTARGAAGAYRAENDFGLKLMQDLAQGFYDLAMAPYAAALRVIAAGPAGAAAGASTEQPAEASPGPAAD